MNARQKKKMRKRICEMVLEDAAMEVSLIPSWRERLFSHPFGTKFLISCQNPDGVPAYVQAVMCRYQLQFYVSKVASCREKFDDGLVIFKFESKEYPRMVRFSGNNPEVV